MNKQTYLNLDYEQEIKDQYPKTVQSIINWFCSREDIVEGLVGMSGDGASVEEVKAAFIQVVPIIIQHDPRKLYEYFDAQGVKICIGIHPDSEEVFIYYNSVQKHSYPANSRAEAEKASFLEAFKIVEERINTDQNQVYQ